LVDLDNTFRTHDAGGNRRPLSVNTTDTFLSDTTEVKNLVTTESHNKDRVLFLALLVIVDYRHDTSAILASL